MSSRSRARVGGWICAVSLQKGGMGVEMRVLVRISPFLLLPDRFRVKPYPSKQKKGGWIFAPKGKLVRGLVCWAKMVHFWKPWNHAFWPSPECREPFSMLPRHALSSFMVWNAGVGPWWQQQLRFSALVSASEHRLLWQRMPDELFNTTQPVRITREGLSIFVVSFKPGM